MNNFVGLVERAAATRKQGSTTHPNREGAPSYFRSLREQVVQILTTNILGNTFYVGEQQMAAETLNVLLRANRECPEFLARALVYARNQGLLRSVPVLGLVVLSGGRTNRALFEAVFDRVILIPDDLRLFVALCRSGSIPGRAGLGGIAALAVKRWLAKMSEYHAVKYGSAVSADVTLRDIIRMAHPRPADGRSAERLGWLVNGESGLAQNASLNPQIRLLEILKQLPSLEAQLAVVKNSNLPYEVVVPAMKETSTELWVELMRRAPYMNLLRNLAAFTRRGVFAQEANVGYAIAKLINPQAVERSKVLPFRFFDAWRKYGSAEGSDSRIADALREALELSFVNLPSFGDRVVAIGTDVSGSMSSYQITNKRSHTPFYGGDSDGDSAYCIDIAGLFTGALLRRIENRAITLPFEGRVRTDARLSSRDDILATAEKIRALGGGSTAVGAPIEYLLHRKVPVDIFIGITDQEEWAHGPGYSCSGGFETLWRRYRNEVAPDAKAYLVTLAAYRDAVTSDKSVRFIYGWSAEVLRYIVLDTESGESQISAIEAIPLRPNGDGKPNADREDAQTDEE